MSDDTGGTFRETASPKQYGLVIEPLDPNDFVLGGDASLENKYGAIENNPTGNWYKFVKHFEDQSTRNGDTYACVLFTITQCIDILSRCLYGDGIDLSARYAAKKTPVNVGYGTSPKKGADCIRKGWSVLEDEWPDVDTLEEYYAEIPEKLDTLAIARGAEYEFGYQQFQASPANVRSVLKRSPVAIAVTAWMEKDGVYVRAPWSENHFTTVIGVHDNDDYDVVDSFPPYRKRVKPEAAQSIAMSFYLRKNVVKPNSFKRFIKLILEYVGL